MRICDRCKSPKTGEYRVQIDQCRTWQCPSDWIIEQVTGPLDLCSECLAHLKASMAAALEPTPKDGARRAGLIGDPPAGTVKPPPPPPPPRPERLQ